MSSGALAKICHLVAMVTHFPLLSYHFETSTRIFRESQDVRFPKMYMIEIATRMVPVTGLAHGLITPRRIARLHALKFGTEFEYGTAGTQEMFKFKGQRSRS